MIFPPTSRSKPFFGNWKWGGSDGDGTPRKVLGEGTFGQVLLVHRDVHMDGDAEDTPTGSEKGALKIIKKG